jgi:RNA polymerase sigma-70 factor, ECF subfamily
VQTNDFDTLYAATHGRIYALARRVLRDEHLSEDAVQEIYLVAFTYLRDFRQECTVETWLYRIALNLLVRRKKQLALRKPAWSGEPVTVEQSGNDVEFAEVLHIALSKFDEDIQKLLWLALYQQMSQAEIAAVLNLPIGTVASRLSRAKTILKVEITKHGYRRR